MISIQGHRIDYGSPGTASYADLNCNSVLSCRKVLIPEYSRMGLKMTVSMNNVKTEDEGATEALLYIFNVHLHLIIIKYYCVLSFMLDTGDGVSSKI